MTALCGGGASAPKAGIAETIIFTAGSLSSLLNNKGGYWATLAAPLLGVLAYSATDLCTTDPPAQPTISDEEYAALLQLGPWDTLTSALVKLGNIVTRVIWYDVCHCVTGATPALPSSTLTPPAGVSVPTYNGGPCPQVRLRVTEPDGDGSSNYRQWHNITRLFFPGLTLYKAAGQATPFVVDADNDIILTPCNWGSFFSTISLVSGTTTTAQGYGYLISCLNASRVMTSTFSGDGVRSDAPYSTEVGTFDCNACRYLMVHHGTTSQVTGPGVFDVTMDITCSGGPVPAADCCSDPAALALMGQLLQQVNLIQRQTVPFAYVQGAAHAALTGSGEIVVQGLLGALVEITGGSTIIGVEDGTPDVTFQAGWISWGNDDGFIDREFIANETLVSLPHLAGQFTRIGYTLAVGVEITITELIRES